MVELTIDNAVAVLTLNDPARRNVLGIRMFDAIDAAVHGLPACAEVQVLLIRGNGAAFCAGFDLAAIVADASQLATFIERLRDLLRTLRRLPQVVVAAVHGAAIAGGCALLSACDFVVVAPDARLGYPVHRLGVSPAVSIHTLAQAIGAGPARALLMSGELISGTHARGLGLATHVARDEASLDEQARALAAGLARKPRHALRVTKAWLNELDGSLDDVRFDEPASGSMQLARHEETLRLLRNWRPASNA